MKPSTALTGLALLLLSVSATATAATPPTQQEAIREHLAHVELSLRMQEVSHLSQTQRLNRRKNLDALREYWVAGIFPQNTDFPGETPYFIDAQGRACAMAHLVIASGARDVAEAVARRENNAFLLKMKTPQLHAWLEESGLTPQEAAWVQPTYTPMCGCDCSGDPVHNVDTGALYLNRCTATQCGQESTADLRTGCPDRDRQNLEYFWARPNQPHCPALQEVEVQAWCDRPENKAKSGSPLPEMPAPETPAPEPQGEQTQAEEDTTCASADAPLPHALWLLALTALLWRRRRD